MPSFDELRLVYQAEHKRLTALYYSGGMSKADFEAAHGQNWATYAETAISLGYMPSPAIPPMWRAQWAAAQTIEEKVAVLAGMLGLGS